MRSVPLVLALLTMTSACQSTANRPHIALTTGAIAPEQAVLAAAEAAPTGVRGRFAMTVRGAGRQSGNLYLNSQPDYRDQRNLTIAMTDATAAKLATMLGGNPEKALIGRQVTVDGVARRVRILFLANGRPSGKYYYQTHVVITDPDALSFGPPV